MKNVSNNDKKRGTKKDKRHNETHIKKEREKKIR